MAKIDVVIPLGKGSRHDNLELRYALRSLEKNLTNLGKVFIVGEKPDWIKNIVHVVCPDINSKNKDANLIRKVAKACARKTLSSEFIRMSDDQLLIKTVKSDQLVLCRDASIKDFVKKLKRNTRWIKRFKNNYRRFPDGWNFDTHTPQKYLKNEFIDLIKVSPNVYKERGGYTINTLYFNHFKYNTDVLSKTLKVDVRSPMSLSEIQSLSKDKLYLSYNDKGFDSIKKYCELHFADKSKFEK